jgi:hypothetical protein
MIPGGAAGVLPTVEPPPSGSSLTFSGPEIPKEPAIANPFAERPPASPNPYAAPANPSAPDPFHTLTGPELAGRAHSKLILPGIGMIVFALTGLAVMALVAIMATLDPDMLFRDVGPDPAEKVGAISFLIAYFGVGFLTRALQILGAIAMLRQRGYGLALSGAVCGLIPCEYFCCLPSLPFAIWALIVLNSAEVRAAFTR